MFYFLTRKKDMWTKGEKIGYGASGNVYETCEILNKEMNCDDFVIKEIEIKNEWDKKKFILETNIAKIAGDLGFGPKIINAFFFESFGIIVIEKFDMNLWNFFKQEKNKKFIKKLLNEPKWILEPVIKMHETGIFHGDLTLTNFLIKFKDENNFKIVVNDFGMSFFPGKKLKNIAKYFDYIALIFGRRIYSDDDCDVCIKNEKNQNQFLKYLQIDKNSEEYKIAKIARLKNQEETNSMKKKREKARSKIFQSLFESCKNQKMKNLFTFIFFK